VGNRTNSSQNGVAKPAKQASLPPAEPEAPAPPGRRTPNIATVSHTLEGELAERLRHFAFRERISESAVIEFSLRAFFECGDDDRSLGERLRQAGASLRRKT